MLFNHSTIFVLAKLLKDSALLAFEWQLSIKYFLIPTYNFTVVAGYHHKDYLWQPSLER